MLFKLDRSTRSSLSWRDLNDKDADYVMKNVRNKVAIWTAFSKERQVIEAELASVFHGSAEFPGWTLQLLREHAHSLGPQLEATFYASLDWSRDPVDAKLQNSEVSRYYAQRHVKAVKCKGCDHLSSLHMQFQRHVPPPLFLPHEKHWSLNKSKQKKSSMKNTNCPLCCDFEANRDKNALKKFHTKAAPLPLPAAGKSKSLPPSTTTDTSSDSPPNVDTDEVEKAVQTDTDATSAKKTTFPVPPLPTKDTLSEKGESSTDDNKACGKTGDLPIPSKADDGPSSKRAKHDSSVRKDEQYSAWAVLRAKILNEGFGTKIVEELDELVATHQFIPDDVFQDAQDMFDREEDRNFDVTTISMSEDAYDHNVLTMAGFTEVDDISIPISYDLAQKQMKMLQNIVADPKVCPFLILSMLACCNNDFSFVSYVRLRGCNTQTIVVGNWTWTRC